MSLRIKYRMVLALALSLAAVGCSKGDFDPIPGSSERGGSSSRGPVEQQRHVVIMVSGGHNSLSNYLSEDLEDIAAGYVPVGTAASTNALVILSRLPVNYLSTTSAPVLYRMYKDAQGTVVRDTLRRFTKEDRLFGGDILHEALLTVRDRLPAKSYGMVVSSHASGWVPPGYYESPSTYERRGKGLMSIGQDKDDNVSVEMDLCDFASALPFTLDYTILDCCLSGGVEVAWQLRGKSSLVAFTQTETMADGFDYKTLMARLLAEPTPNPRGVCEDFYNYYMAKSGVNQSATISLVDTRKMDNLALVCAQLFDAYRAQINGLNGSAVQGFFRYDRHYFYDLQDILVKAGITSVAQETLQNALDECILYKAATPWFMSGTMYGFEISNYCGLSMYLPSMGTAYLNNYYTTHIAWNEATKLVE